MVAKVREEEWSVEEDKFRVQVCLTELGDRSGAEECDEWWTGDRP